MARPDQAERRPAGLLVLCFLFLAGCNIFASNVKINTPDGREYMVHAKADTIVEFQEGDIKIKTDTRGRPSFLETLLGGLIVKVPKGIKE